MVVVVVVVVFSNSRMNCSLFLVRMLSHPVYGCFALTQASNFFGLGAWDGAATDPQNRQELLSLVNNKTWATECHFGKFCML